MSKIIIGKNNQTYRVIVYDEWRYLTVYGMREGRVARFLDNMLRKLHGSEWLREQCRLDRIACGIDMGEMSPWWCLPSFVYKFPDRLTRLFLTRFDVCP